jgi:hypothetical protein
MNFTFAITTMNTHETSMDVLFTPSEENAALGASPWFAKVWYTADEYVAAVDKDAFLKALIVKNVPAQSWTTQMAVVALQLPQVVETTQVAVTAEEYEASRPVVTPAENMLLNREYVKNALDQLAGVIRSRNISSGQAILEEYNEAFFQANAFVEASYVGDVPPMVQSYMDAYTLTANVAADTIVASALALKALLNAVRAVRLAGKAAIDNAADADVQATYELYVEQLNAL